MSTTAIHVGICCRVFNVVGYIKNVRKRETRVVDNFVATGSNIHAPKIHNGDCPLYRIAWINFAIAIVVDQERNRFAGRQLRQGRHDCTQVKRICVTALRQVRILPPSHADVDGSFIALLCRKYDRAGHILIVRIGEAQRFISPHILRQINRSVAIVVYTDCCRFDRCHPYNTAACHTGIIVGVPVSQANQSLRGQLVLRDKRVSPILDLTAAICVNLRDCKELFAAVAEEPSTGVIWICGQRQIDTTRRRKFNESRRIRSNISRKLICRAITVKTDFYLRIVRIVKPEPGGIFRTCSFADRGRYITVRPFFAWCQRIPTHFICGIHIANDESRLHSFIGSNHCTLIKAGDQDVLTFIERRAEPSWPVDRCVVFRRDDVNRGAFERVCA